MTNGHAKLAAIERAAIAEEIASLLRHDLRNRLAAIGNATTYLRRRTERTELWQSDKRVPRFYELVTGELEQADRLLEKHANLDHLFARSVDRVGLRDCAEHARRLVDPARAAEVVVDIAPDAAVEADRAEVILMIRCLLDNAVEATDEPEPVSIQLSSRATSHLLELRDRGPGFADDAQRRAFTAFETTKPGHAGLGLNIARRIARRYGGSVDLGSAPDGGALVAVVLPLHPLADGEELTEGEV